MADIIKIKKGLDIPVSGGVDSEQMISLDPGECGIVPDDFPGYKWKAVVAPGDKIAEGEPLMRAKENPDICLVSPLAGTVKEICRGERRHIEHVSVVASGAKADFVSHAAADATSAEEWLGLLCHSGLWAMLRQRPYDIVPDPAIIPRDIFVTAFDSAPLAPPLTTPDMEEDLESGLEVLSHLTSGRVYLGIPYESRITSRVAVVYEFQGPHPAGNAGVQAANIKPVDKGDVIWTLDSRTAVRIGRLKRTGRFDATAEVAITGPEALNVGMVNTLIGASLSSLLAGQLPQDDRHLRVVSGNLLTGYKVDPHKGFLRFPYRQISIIEEGDRADEFMGWASLSPAKYSVKRSFLSKLLGGKGAHFDARIKGGHRAPILSGEYDKVFPMDIYPEFLLKAIEAGDIDKMEELGIYEVAPEDFALPEFVDTSKRPLQQIVREGLDNLRKELS